MSLGYILPKKVVGCCLPRTLWRNLTKGKAPPPKSPRAEANKSRLVIQHRIILSIHRMTGIQSVNQTKNCQPLALTNNHEVDWSTKPFDNQFRRNACFDACLYMLGVRHKVSKLAICRTINSVCYTGFFREKGKGKGNYRREKRTKATKFVSFLVG